METATEYEAPASIHRSKEKILECINVVKGFTSLVDQTRERIFQPGAGTSGAGAAASIRHREDTHRQVLPSAEINDLSDPSNYLLTV